MLKKGDISQAVGQSLESKEVIKLIDELPKDLMAMVATQLDIKDFADILIEQFQDILGEITLK